MAATEKYIFKGEEYSKKRNPLTRDAILKVEFPKSFLKQELVSDFEIKDDKFNILSSEFTVLDGNTHAKKLVFYQVPDDKKKKNEVVDEFEENVNQRRASRRRGNTTSGIDPATVWSGFVTSDSVFITSSPTMSSETTSAIATTIAFPGFLREYAHDPRNNIFSYDIGERCDTYRYMFHERMYYFRTKLNSRYAVGFTSELPEECQSIFNTVLREFPSNDPLTPFPWYWLENPQILTMHRGELRFNISSSTHVQHFSHIELNSRTRYYPSRGHEQRPPSGEPVSSQNNALKKHVFYTLMTDKQLKDKGFERRNSYEYFLASQTQLINGAEFKNWEKFGNSYRNFRLHEAIPPSLRETVHGIIEDVTKLSNLETYLSTDGVKYTFGLEIETTQGLIPMKDRIKLNMHCERDGSLNGGGGGPEFITGVLRGDSGVLMCQKMFKILSSKASVDKYCSIHLHIGNISMDKRFVVNLFLIGKMIEEELFTIVAPSRRSNEYCKRLPNLSDFIEEKFIDYHCTPDIMYDKVFKDIFQQASDGVPLSEKLNSNSNHPRGAKAGYNHRNIRYCWLNLIPLIFNTRGDINSKTIEIRLHQGTLNFNKFYNWLLLCFAIIRYAENNFVIDKNIKSLTLKEIITNSMKKKADQLLTYLEERKATFADKQAEAKEQLERTTEYKKIKEIICV